MLADIVINLRREFNDELGHLGRRDLSYESRIPEGHVAKPPRLNITPSFLHRRGTFLPISQIENFLNPTFAEILTRVSKRDEATGAIINVKRKADAPQNEAENTNSALPDLKFSLTQADDGKNVVIVLSEKNGKDENVYERYILRMNDVMRAELRLQKQFQETQKAS